MFLSIMVNCGVNNVLELIGTSTLKDSLLCASQGGTVLCQECLQNIGQLVILLQWNIFLQLFILLFTTADK